MADLSDPSHESKSSSPLTWENISRTYTGLLDDVMIRYSRDYADEQFFNRTIIKNVLFGGGVFINDGYIVLHEIARRQLENDSSLLRYMINTDFVRVLTRTKSKDELRSMPEEMASRGIESYKDLVSSNDWLSFRPLWSRLSNSLYRNNNPRSWPKYNMSEGFTKLIRRVFPSDPKDVGIESWTPEQLASLEKKFNEMDPATGNARDRFEKSALFVLTGREVVSQSEMSPTQVKMMVEIMDIANQAYHYNFGLTMTRETKETGSESYGVAVDTTIGKAFDELLKVEQVRRAQLKDIPIIRLPPNLPVDQGFLFYSFLDPVSKISQAKIGYLDSLQELFSGDLKDVTEARRRVRESTLEYKSRIFETFKLRSDDDELFTASLGMTNVGSNENVPVVASNNPVLSMSLANSNRRLDSLMALFDVVDVTEEFSGSHDADPSVVNLEQIRPQICSVAFNEKAAIDHTDGLSSFS